MKKIKSVYKTFITKLVYIARAEALYARAKNDYFKNNPEETQYVETEATGITLILNNLTEHSTKLRERL
jgi:hypothetical protein